MNEKLLTTAEKRHLKRCSWIYVKQHTDCMTPRKRTPKQTTCFQFKCKHAIIVMELWNIQDWTPCVCKWMKIACWNVFERREKCKEFHWFSWGKFGFIRYVLSQHNIRANCLPRQIHKSEQNIENCHAFMT